jgi:phosphonate transport system substrate-binding protein
MPPRRNRWPGVRDWLPPDPASGARHPNFHPVFHNGLIFLSLPTASHGVTHMLRRTFCALIATAALTAPAFAQDVKSLNFGIISTESSSNLRSAWQPVIDDLSKAVGVPVKPFFASDYAGVIEGMRFNKVQVAWYGNASAVEAVDRAQGEVFAHVIDKDGNPGYWSVLVTAKDGKVKDLDYVLKNGKTMSYGAGDPNSTSGTAVPGYYLWGANKIDPKSFFKNFRIANHETNLLSAMNGQVDVAITNTEALARYQINTGKAPEDKIRILWKSPLIPADPLVWRADLPAGLKKKIQAFFVNYGRTGPNAAQEMANLQKLNYKGFQASDNSQLLPIRQIKLAGDRNKIESDTTLSAEEKKQKLAEIDGKLAELSKQVAAAGKAK